MDWGRGGGEGADKVSRQCPAPNLSQSGVELGSVFLPALVFYHPRPKWLTSTVSVDVTEKSTCF